MTNREREDQMFGPAVGERTLDDIFTHYTVDRSEVLERLIQDLHRPRLEQTPERYDPTQPRFRRWVGEVRNTTPQPPEVLAKIRMPTRRLARWSKYRAFNKALAELHTEQEETT
jgi:hypothetical protein